MSRNFVNEIEYGGPRFLLAAMKSGSGKTTITCGMIRALQNRGLKVASMKCGPDYIDPMFHRRTLGIKAGNIDTFFTDEKTTRFLLNRHTRNADITVIEGVMGYYDGVGGVTSKASSYEVATVTKTPVILVVDAKGASVTLAAVIKGIVDFKEDSNIEGIILNRISSGYYDRIKSVIEDEVGVRVIGYMPEMEELKVPSRHLGLVAPEEIYAFDSWISNVAEMLEQYIDVEAVLDIAGYGADYGDDASGNVLVSEKTDIYEIECIPKFSRKYRMAVARDEAFSFYYKENLELLEDMGAELVEFSPMHDTFLPEEIDAVILGGGYPELYAKELSENQSMKNSILEAINSGIAIAAECGGFMYLMKELEDIDGKSYPMVGYFEGKAFNAGKLTRFGYIELRDLSNKSFAGSIKAHEFHKWDTNVNGNCLTAFKPATNANYECMHFDEKMMAGYPHLYYYSNVQAIYNFFEKACTK